MWCKTMKNYSVTHVVDSLHLSSGGPSRTVVALCDSLSYLEGIELTLLNQLKNNEATVESLSIHVDRKNCSSSIGLLRAGGFPLKKELLNVVKEDEPALIHSHGVWLPANHWAAQLSKKENIPLIIQPRGMLEPWALNHKLWKKKLAMWLFQKEDLQQAKMLIATSHQEYENFRKIGLTQPIAVIPNGVTMAHNEPEALKNKGKRRQALFLSRIHPKKGLIILIEAWARIQPNQWELIIAGPDEGNHLHELKSLSKKLNVDSSIKFVGEVYGQNKSNLYRYSDLFVLPTFSENFGVVVAEALSYGIPVITTKGAPWADLAHYNCGWWIDIGVESLVTALKDATELSDEDRYEMGSRGIGYVSRFDWSRIATSVKEVYDYILGKRNKPSNVYES